MSVEKNTTMSSVLQYQTKDMFNMNVAYVESHSVSVTLRAEKVLKNNNITFFKQIFECKIHGLSLSYALISSFYYNDKSLKSFSTMFKMYRRNHYVGIMIEIMIVSKA